jgi:hypothetical protein
VPLPPPLPLPFGAVPGCDGHLIADGRNCSYTVSPLLEAAPGWLVTIRPLGAAFIRPRKLEAVPFVFSSAQDARDFCAFHNAYEGPMGVASRDRPT